MLLILQFIFADFWHWIGSFFFLYLFCQTIIGIVKVIGSVILAGFFHVHVEGKAIVEDDDDDHRPLEPKTV